MEKFNKFYMRIILLFIIGLLFISSMNTKESNKYKEIKQWENYQIWSIWNEYSINEQKRIDFEKHMNGKYKVVDGVLIQKIYKYSKKYNMNPYLVSAFIQIESGFTQYAKSHCDARGYMQLMLNTANVINKNLKVADKITKYNIYETDINLQLGIYHLSELKEEYEGDLMKMIIAYNAGRYYANKSIHRIPDETKDYILKLFTLVNRDINLDF